MSVLVRCSCPLFSLGAVESLQGVGFYEEIFVLLLPCFVEVASLLLVSRCNRVRSRKQGVP